MCRELGELGEGGRVEVEELGTRRRMSEEAGEAGGIAGGEETLRFDRREEAGCGLHGDVVDIACKERLDDLALDAEIPRHDKTLT